MRGSECESGSVRLVDGSRINEGLVELCIFQTWHPLCDGFFSNTEANVICRWLGYSFATGILETDKKDDNS